MSIAETAMANKPVGPSKRSLPVSAASASSGTYRVLVTGGLEAARGELVVRLDDTIKKFEVRGGEGARTAAVVSVAP